MFRRSFLVSVIAAVSFGLASFLPAHAGDKTLTVFAAASMKGSLDTVAALYEKKSGVKVAISFAASSALAKQIEQAAPADLFLSADTRWMSYLTDKGLVKKEEVVKLLGNRLVLVAEKNSSITLKIEKGFALAAALGDSRLAMGEVRSVPAGKYGKEALEFYDVWKDVKSRIAGAENVRAALQLVTLGEAPLGIVYATDALAAPRLSVLGIFPPASHPAVTYPFAQTRRAEGNAGARALLGFLTGAEAAPIWRRHGFALAG